MALPKAIEKLTCGISTMGIAHQARTQQQPNTYPHIEPVIITDPPYYDNISYADLSDFFYIWLRPLLRDMPIQICSRWNADTQN